MELTAHFDQALRRLNWVEVDSSPDAARLPCPDTNGCWLRACSELGAQQLGTRYHANVELNSPPTSSTPTSKSLLRNPAQGSSKRAYLNRAGRSHIQRLLGGGWTLRSCWPRDWCPSIDRWLGRRLILGHASVMAANTRLLSLVSSRVGRHGNRQPDWPHWLDGALRYAHRQRERLLIVPDTTLAPMVEHFARVANLPCTTLRWSAQTHISQWLYDVLSAIASPTTAAPACGRSPSEPLESMWISPPLYELSHDFQTAPLQDRLSLAFADSVLALDIRAGGNLERLITERLQDPLFPAGSVYVTLPRASPTRRLIPGNPHEKTPTGHTDWLRRGAVGWVTCQPSPTARSPLYHCRSASQASHERPLDHSLEPSVYLDASPWVVIRYDQPLWQLCGPLPAAWRKLEAHDNWPYFVHCTRGTLGPFPEESMDSFRERLWLQGDAVALHPLETLARICQQRRLRSTCGITRTDGPCVSFSAVPLAPLLQRRTFQVHLGRWDWEPYGLLIGQQPLLAAGAAQVIYGNEDDFLKLTAEKKPLFQPRHRRPGKSGQAAWTEEREWRVLHDIDLRTLPVGSILAFTRTRREAQQLSQYAAWPVLWTEPK